MQTKERTPLRAATAAKRMRLRTASVRRRGARATTRRSRRVVLHGLDSGNHEVGQGSGSDASKRANSSSGSYGSQEDAAEDCLSAQEGGASDDTP